MRRDCMPVPMKYYVVDKEGIKREIDVDRRGPSPSERELEAGRIFAEGLIEELNRGWEVQCRIKRKDFRAWKLLRNETNNSRKFRGLPLRRGKVNWR